MEHTGIKRKLLKELTNISIYILIYIIQKLAPCLIANIVSTFNY
jgi:hypothetical protein